MSEGFRNLAVWQKAVALSIRVYRVSAGFPDSERFGLVSQLRRAAVSIASNIAEGRGRFSRREFARSVSIARGSAAEVETQLEIAAALDYLPVQTARELIRELDEISRMLRALKISLDSAISEPSE